MEFWHQLCDDLRQLKWLVRRKLGLRNRRTFQQLSEEVACVGRNFATGWYSQDRSDCEKCVGARMLLNMYVSGIAYNYWYNGVSKCDHVRRACG